MIRAFARLAGLIGAVMAFSAGAALASPGLTSDAVTMRSGPGPRFRPVITVPGSAMVDVQGCGTDWCRISWNYRTGYIPAELLEAPSGPAYGAGGPDYIEPAPPVYLGPPVVVAPFWGPGWGRGWRR